MSLNAETASIYRALGLPENRPLPPHTIGPVIAPVTGYNGIVRYYWNVRLLSNYDANQKHKPVRQRVQAQCPVCYRWFSAGNLRQHLHGYRTRKGRIAGCTGH